mgnify:CR=1 FL=1
MNNHECPFEAEVLQQIERTGDLSAAPDLKAHVEQCAVCADLAVVGAAFQGALEEATASASVPDAGHVWRRAQIRAQREAIRDAGRPITAAQVIAFGAAMGLIGACLGATSTSFQAALAWAGSHWAALDQTAWLGAAASFVASHALFAAGLGAAMLLVPVAVLVAVLRE